MKSHPSLSPHDLYPLASHTLHSRANDDEWADGDDVKTQTDQRTLRLSTRRVSLGLVSPYPLSHQPKSHANTFPGMTTSVRIVLGMAPCTEKAADLIGYGCINDVRSSRVAVSRLKGQCEQRC